IESERAPGRLRRRRALLFTLVLAVVGFGIAFVSWRTPTKVRADRSEVGSPYQNTRPGVKYLGDAACARCHAEIGETYRQHPMGRSLAPIGEAGTIGGDERSGRPLFQAQGLEYAMERRDGRVFHLETRRDA